MREIKFRGLSIDGKSWHIGNLSIIDTDLNSSVKKGYYISNSIGSPFAYQVRPETVGLNSNFPDKNGKDIFEGDIIKQDIFEGYIGKVVFSDGAFHTGSSWLSNTDEIIGNVFNNPELLNK